MRTIAKWKLLVLAVVLGGVLSGCGDNILDVNPPASLSQETFWKTADHAIRAINAAYDPLTSYWLYGGFIYMEVLSNNAYSHYPWEGYKALGTGNDDPTQPGAVAGRWAAAYQGIGRVNTLLANLGGIEMDDALKRRIEGEAYFLRALYYHNLVNYYGGVPLITEPPSLEQADLPRASRQEVIDLILSDLDKAIQRLPRSYSGSDVGRATKGAAMALKARMLLYNEQWTEAAQAAKAVMDLGIYSLFPDYRGLFLPANENNQEVIFSVQFKVPEQTHAWDTYLSPGTATNIGWGSIVPLPNLIDDYHMKDGEPISESPLYDPKHPYENRDPRFYETILYPGAEFRGMTYGEDFEPSFNYTGFFFRKYTEYTEAPSPGISHGQSDINYIVLRYADVLLMYAEAQNEATGPDQSVYDAINEVRSRAGMPPVKPGLNQARMREVIRHERRIEFAGEGLWYSDILRWRIAEEVIPAVEFETRRFDPSRDYLWPIPQGEMQLNPNLKQNPGY